MEYMRKYLGAEIDDIYVFGDSSNDLVMFEYAKHNVAMGKHDPVLEPYAELITDDVDEDGIFHALEKLGII
jgi:hydroxymethylpyrimidine pyrophosphatase-like HAD family hydrolase